MTERTPSEANERRIADTLERIRKRLGIETFETRGRDALDFHDISAAAIRDAVRMAFEAGYDAGFQDARLLYE